MRNNYDNFHDWFATKREVDDIEAFLDIDLYNEHDDPTPGVVFDDAFYIEKRGDEWHLLVERSEYTSPDLYRLALILWLDFARFEYDWDHKIRFDVQHGPNYLRPGEAIELIDAGYEDESWRNDIAPAFDRQLGVIGGEHECYVRIWADHVFQHEREDNNPNRFTVSLYADTDMLRVLYEGNDLGTAIQFGNLMTRHRAFCICFDRQ